MYVSGASRAAAAAALFSTDVAAAAVACLSSSHSFGDSIYTASAFVLYRLRCTKTEITFRVVVNWPRGFSQPRGLSLQNTTRPLWYTALGILENRKIECHTEMRRNFTQLFIG